MEKSIINECKKNLEKLIGKKIVKVDFKIYDDECWRIHLSTDEGRFVMSFCRSWTYPIVEHRKHRK